MTENNNQNKPNTTLGSHIFCLGTDVWQLQADKIEVIKKLFPNSQKLDQLIQIAQILDKYQKEIDYYQTRIRKLLGILREKKKNN